jgi:hypothetical protein
MKNKLFIFSTLFVCLSVFAASGRSFADDDYEVKGGSSEFSTAFQYQSVSGSSSTVLLGEYGFYLNKKLEIGALVNVSTTGSYGTTMIDPMAKVHFIHAIDNPKLVPYAGASLVLGNTTGSGTGNIIGLELQGGLDAFLSPKAAITPELSLASLSTPGGSQTPIALRVFLKVFF